MSSELSSASTEAEQPLADLAEVGRYASYSAGSERGLVVLAMGLPYWLVPAADGYTLLVHAAEAHAVRDQLSRFERESLHWPPRPLEPAASIHRGDFLAPLLWAAVVLFSFRAQHASPGWVRAGVLDGNATIGNGEVWRAFTALFLHADVGHVLSNLAGGIFSFAVVSATFGRVRGWLLLGLSAVLGNLLTAAVRFPEPYSSLGASTAIFAAIGLLTGRAARLAAHASSARFWQGALLPLAAGAIVLGLYGAGEARVDVGAHVAGFVTGGLAGFAAARVRAYARLDR